MSQLPPEFVVETFKCSTELSSRLSAASFRLDRPKSKIIREALTEYLRTIDLVEGVVREVVIADFLRASVKPRAGKEE